MKIGMFLLFVLLSLGIVFAYEELLLPICDWIISLSKLWSVLFVAATIIPIRALVGAVFNKLKIILSRFNSFEGTGRLFITIPAWLLTLYYAYLIILVLIDNPTLQSAGALVFFANASITMIVNFCYVKYNNL